MQDRRKVLFGVDVIAGVHVSLKHYRTQIEYELRSKLIRLRQQGAQVLSDPAALEALRGFGIDLLYAGTPCPAGVGREIGHRPGP